MKIVALILLTTILTSAQEIKVSSGKLERYKDFKSEFVQARNIDIWLPEGYNSKEKYAVLYMHDGQMLYDAETTWNKQAWEVDETAAKIQAGGRTQKFIVVGIWNIAALRHSDYFPQKPFESLTKAQQDSLYAIGKNEGSGLFGSKINSDNYLKFIVKELKPFIDKTFSVYKDPQHTFIAGSSMGGLISMYAICEYPKIFGGAGCLSTHWPGTFSVDKNPIPKAFLDYLKQHLPTSKNHKIYFDYGDQTLDALYKPFQLEADAIMKAKGYTSKSWVTKFFAGDDHSEKSWMERLHVPLVFLLGK